MKKLHKKEEDNVDAWLMTYADMITLLLCFFAILLSVSEPKKEKYEQLKEQIMSKFGMVQTMTPFQTLHDSLLVTIESQQLERDVTVKDTGQGLEIELSSGAFFEPGQATFRKEGIPMLTEVVSNLKGMDYQNYAIDVEGHTDDVPISNTIFPSNWELSAGRAAQVVRFFVENGIEATRLKASGYAETRPKVPNVDAVGNSIPANQALNRRIVIQLKRTK